MVDRPNKPAALASPGLAPQAQANVTHDNGRVRAVLPSGESVDVLLFGATVISWKGSAGDERMWLSDAAKLDGSKAVRGGIPLVFPVFGTAPDHAATSKLPQHGFARNSTWEFLGSSTSESTDNKVSVKLDFGLSQANLSDEAKQLWPHPFSLVYNVTLSTNSLGTGLVITNQGKEAFEAQMLLHTYLRISDITKVSVAGLENAQYVDKVDGAQTKTQSGAVTIAGEVDRVYSPATSPSEPVVVLEGGEKRYTVVRDNLDDVVVWNPWIEKSKGMGDFEPKDGYKNMICIEAGAVRTWQKLDPGDAFEGAQVISV